MPARTRNLPNRRFVNVTDSTEGNTVKLIRKVAKEIADALVEAGVGGHSRDDEQRGHLAVAARCAAGDESVI